jgi:hypothetical protein
VNFSAYFARLLSECHVSTPTIATLNLMAFKENHGENKTSTKPQQEKERSKSDGRGKRDMNIADFLFDSVYQIVTWVCIALAVGGIWYFASRDNSRGILWAAIALFCSIAIMIGIIADGHFFRKGALKKTTTEEKNAVQDAPESSLEKSLRTSNRAYVGIKAITADLKNGRVLIDLENTGKVPANDMKVIAHELRVIEGAGGEVVKVIGNSGPVIEAGHVQLYPGTFHLRVEIPLKGFTAKERKLILAKKVILSVAGKIQFGDGFGNPASSDFALRYTPPPNEGWSTIRIVTFDELQKMNPEDEKQREKQKNPN